MRCAGPKPRDHISTREAPPAHLSISLWSVCTMAGKVKDTRRHLPERIKHASVEGTGILVISSVDKGASSTTVPCLIQGDDKGIVT